MQYKNGRAVQVGDPVFGFDGQGYPMAGVVIRTLPEANHHNIHVVPVRGIVPGYRSGDFVHADDALASDVQRAMKFPPPPPQPQPVETPADAGTADCVMCDEPTPAAEPTSEPKEEYEYINAVYDCGEISWTYKLKGSDREGWEKHDEDVDGWSDEDLINLTMSILDVDESQRSAIKLEII